MRKSAIFTLGLLSALSVLLQTGCGTTPANDGAGTLSITTAALPSATVGAAYSASLAAGGGVAPYTFSMGSGSVPASFALSPAGLLTGTPSEAGTASLTVLVADAVGEKLSKSFSLKVGGALTVSTATLPNGTVGAAYSSTVTVSGGTAPYVFTLTSGSAPSGLSLTGAGVLSGMPSSAGTASFTVAVADAAGAQAKQTYSVTIGSAAVVTGPTITTTTLPAGTVGASYSGKISASGGTAPYVFTRTSGNLPTSVDLTGAGSITGTPTAAGTYTFTVTVADANGLTANQSYSVTIAAASSVLALAGGTLSTGTVGVQYSAPISATGGTAPYSYTIASGMKPAGTDLSTGGLLTGTPTTANTYSFTVKATDAAGATASAIYSVEIDASASAALTLTTNVLPNGIVNANYNNTLSVSNGVAPYTYKVTAGTLTGTVQLSSAGLLSGVPSAAGSYPFTVSFTDSNGQSSSANLTLTVTTASATVVVETTAPPLAVVPANFFGLHTSVYDANLSDTSTLPTLLANTGITTLRYPGGGYSDNYHWAQHSITPFYATSSGACGVASNGVLEATSDFGHFAKLLQAASVSGLITINYGNSVADSAATVKYGKDGRKTCSEPNTAGQPQEAAAWVAYANGDPSSTQMIGKDAAGFDWKTVGFWASLRAASPLSTDDGYNMLRIGHAASLGVKFWEIGNEMYYNGWATNHNAESDNHAPYIYSNGYASGTFNSRASLAALSPTAYGTNAVQFINAMKAVDSTIKIGVDFSSPISTDPIPTTWNPDLAQAVCAGANIDIAIMHYYPGTWKAVQPGELLSLPQADIPTVAAGIRKNLADYCPANASKIEVWLTETSPNGALAQNFPTPVIGLFTLNDFMTALTTGIQNLDWLELHDGTFLTASNVPGPSYYGLLLAHQLAGVGDTAVKTTSSTSTIVSYATVKQNGKKGVLLINVNSSSSITVQVTVNGATLGSTATQYSYGVNAAQSGTALTSTSFAVPGNTFAVTVPAYTAVELIIP